MARSHASAAVLAACTAVALPRAAAAQAEDALAAAAAGALVTDLALAGRATPTGRAPCVRAPSSRPGAPAAPAAPAAHAAFVAALTAALAGRAERPARDGVAYTLVLDSLVAAADAGRAYVTVGHSEAWGRGAFSITPRVYTFFRAPSGWTAPTSRIRSFLDGELLPSTVLPPPCLGQAEDAG